MSLGRFFKRNGSKVIPQKETVHIVSLGFQNGRVLITPAEGITIGTLRMCLGEALEQVRLNTMMGAVEKLLHKEPEVKVEEENEAKEEKVLS